jgi:hypothetical protein
VDELEAATAARAGGTDAAVVAAEAVAVAGAGAGEGEDDGAAGVGFAAGVMATLAGVAGVLPGGAVPPSIGDATAVGAGLLAVTAALADRDVGLVETRADAVARAGVAGSAGGAGSIGSGGATEPSRRRDETASPRRRPSVTPSACAGAGAGGDAGVLARRTGVSIDNGRG